MVLLYSLRELNFNSPDTVKHIVRRSFIQLL